MTLKIVFARHTTDFFLINSIQSYKRGWEVMVKYNVVTRDPWAISLT